VVDVEIYREFPRPYFSTITALCSYNAVIGFTANPVVYMAWVQGMFIAYIELHS
jgi:hypothetical protein